MIKDDILLSIVILTYNHKKYISQALNSVLMQKMEFSYEILISDDDSTDGTRELLREYQKKNSNIKLFLHDINIGASRSIYELLKETNGKYIAFLEGDDFWIDEEKLIKQISFLEKNEYIGCTHECKLVNQDGKNIKGKVIDWVYKDNLYNLDKSEGYLLPGQIGSLVCRNIFKKDNLDYSIIYKVNAQISDRTIMILLSMNGEIYRLPLVLGAYRINERNRGQNVTFTHYVQNKHFLKDDFDMTCILEDYINQYSEFGGTNFDRRKKVLFGNCVNRWLVLHDSDYLKDVYKMFNSGKISKWKLLKTFLYEVKHRGKNE